MPADLTAAALIALLRERPGACELLGVTVDDGAIQKARSLGNLVSVWQTDGGEVLECFRRWLTGAAVEKHVELGIGLPVDLGGDRERAWLTNHDYMPKKDANEWTYHPTLLHALLAGLEAHAKQ